MSGKRESASEAHLPPLETFVGERSNCSVGHVIGPSSPRAGWLLGRSLGRRMSPSSSLSEPVIELVARISPEISLGEKFAYERVGKRVRESRVSHRQRKSGIATEQRTETKKEIYGQREGLLQAERRLVLQVRQPILRTVSQSVRERERERERETDRQTDRD